MKDDLNKKGPRDASKINLDQEWEVKWWTNTLGVSRQQLEKAVKEIGPSVEKVKEYLKVRNSI